MIFFLFLPQFFLLFFILIQLLTNVEITHSIKNNFPIIDREVYLQTFFGVFIFFLLIINFNIEGLSINYHFIFNKITLFLQVILTLIVLLILPSIFNSFKMQNLNFFEFFTIFLSSLFSMFFIFNANSLLSIFVLVELQSLCFYILASYNKTSCYSTEAGLKYFILSAVFSAFFLFGGCSIYFCLGTVNLNEILLLNYYDISNFNEFLNLKIQVGTLLITFWFLFKIACAPFHSWAPDVYEGSPLSATIIFSTLSKLSIIFFLMKLVFAFHATITYFKTIFLFFGILSCFIGTFLALHQKRLKRMIIYSSIAQVGFICSAIFLNTTSSFNSAIFFLLVYIVTSIIIWNVIAQFYSNQQKITYFTNINLNTFYISDLNNLFKKNKPIAFLLTVVFFSISGIPPLLGFYGKFFIFSNLILDNETFFAIILIIISSISVFYYLRVIKILFFEVENLNTVNKKNFQLTINTENTTFINFINCFLIFLLIFGTFFPEYFFLFANYITFF